MTGFAAGRIGVARRAPSGGCRRPRPSFRLAVNDYRWVVARTRASAEFAVADDLAAVGFCGYAPHGVRVDKHARVNGSNSVRREVVREYPIFPGYVFVGCPEGLYVSRKSHDAIIGILGDALGRPGVAPAAIAMIDALHAAGQWDALARAKMKRPECLLKPGERVLVEDLCGISIEGVVAELRGAGVMVDVSVFGGISKFEIPLDKIKQIDV